MGILRFLETVYPHLKAGSGKKEKEIKSTGITNGQNDVLMKARQIAAPSNKRKHTSIVAT